MSLVNYEADSSEEEEEQEQNNVIQTKTETTSSTTRRINLPPPSHPLSSNTIIDDDDDEIHDDDDEDSMNTNTQISSHLLANLPKPHESSTSNTDINTTEIPETELEDIVRGDNKEYTKNIPQLPKPIKRKRDGPVKIFIPTIEEDSDDEDKPKRKQSAIKGNCALLNALPPPMYDEDKPTPSLPTVNNPTTPQISSTGLFIPYTLNKKQQQKKSSININNQLNEKNKNDSDIEDDDNNDDNQTDFLGLTKSNQIQISNTDVESVLRETFPKFRPTVIEEPSIPTSSQDFEDLDDNQEVTNQPINDDDELLRYLPKSERYKEIKHVHIDSMLGDNARIQLLKNVTEERETMKKQAAIHVPKGETRKRAQITYLIAKAQHDDLQLKNMWSEQKLTKRQTQAKYGF